MEQKGKTVRPSAAFDPREIAARIAQDTSQGNAADVIVRSKDGVLVMRMGQKKAVSELRNSVTRWLGLFHKHAKVSVQPQQLQAKQDQAHDDGWLTCEISNDQPGAIYNFNRPGVYYVVGGTDAAAAAAQDVAFNLAIQKASTLLGALKHDIEKDTAEFSDKAEKSLAEVRKLINNIRRGEVLT